MENVLKVAKLAKQKGYVVAVKNGKLQFQTVVYDANGKAKITRHTGFLTPTEALDIICAS